MTDTRDVAKVATIGVGDIVEAAGHPNDLPGPATGQRPSVSLGWAIECCPGDPPLNDAPSFPW